MPAMLLLLTAAVPTSFSLPPASSTAHLRLFDCGAAPSTGCSGAPARSPYRVGDTADPGQDVKMRALAEDGARCPLMGPALCATSAKAVYRSGHDPFDTVVHSFVPFLAR